MSLEKRYAIVVGTNNYEVAGSLQYAIKDAQDINSILQERCEFEPENNYEANNIKEQILAAFQNIRDKGFNEGMHTLFFYFSGHGEFEESEDNSYLILSDSEKISVKDIFNSMCGISEKNNYLIIDACQSGECLLGGVEKGKKREMLHYNSQGIYALFGSKQNQSSYEPSLKESVKLKIKNGILTHYFIEILNDKNRYVNEILSFATIYGYVATKVQSIKNHTQTPVAQMTGAHPLGIWKDKIKEFNQKDVFFIAYKEGFENYYHERQADIALEKLILNQSNVWVSGEAGWGKSNLIVRNIIKNKHGNIYCDMSPLEISNIDDILQEIIDTLLSKYDYLIRKQDVNKIKELTNILSTLSSDLGSLILLIDELGIQDNVLYTGFVEKITNLTNYYTNNVPNSFVVKIIVSTRKNPQDFCKDKSKMSGLFQFLPLEKWENNDLLALFMKIDNILKMGVKQTDIQKIITQSNGNPRLLKNILEKIFTYRDDHNWTIDECIKVTLYEHI